MKNAHMRMVNSSEFYSARLTSFVSCGHYSKEPLSAFHVSSGDPDWMFAPVDVEDSHRKPVYLFDIQIPFGHQTQKVGLSSTSPSIMAKAPQPEEPTWP